MCSILRIIKTLITFLCLVAIILFPLKYADHETHAATKDEILDAHVRIDVEWNNYNPGNSNIARTGSLFVEVRGKIIRTPDRDPFSYSPKNLVANYNYSDRGVDIRPSPGCPELYSEQKGSGVVRILDVDEVKDRTKDGFLRIGLGLQSQGRTPARQKPISKEPAVYTFGLGVPMATTLTKQSTACSRYETIPYSAGAILSSYLDLTKRGMVGSYSWTSNKLEPALQILDYLGQSQFTPQKGAGNVNYRVSWNFGKPKPMVEIWWEGKNVTDKHQNVVVGKKIELKAVVQPGEKPAPKGSWDIGEIGPGGNVIKKYKADKDKGEVIYLDPGKDLEGPEISFYIFKGEKMNINYKTDEGSTETTFIINKPAYTLEINASPGSTFKKVGKGARLDPKQCWVTPTCTGDGVQYDGIWFTCTLQDQNAGEIQWVQIIEQETTRMKDVAGGVGEWLIEEALDGCYPYQYGNKAKDAPAVCVPIQDPKQRELIFAGKTQTNRMYLMFKPKQKESEWVPLKVIPWEWTGALQKSAGKWDKEPVITKGAKNVTAQDATNYPVWTINAGDGTKYKRVR